ncbi:polyphenol oxidase A1, chloroplastic-like [Abrus precatorius]|uniref:Polyphenol oxidase A1, chloroplastic-like n=1 Tax=Abrus precatorius TaxID=3816 RepID=A0A8B8KQK3_ABRPR|nr:polyphenol oxidase A1, chloroplastic-like [Abrus precatorius]
MASTSPLSCLSLTNNFSAPLPISICCSCSLFPLFPKPCQSTKHSKPKRHHVSKVSCNSNQNNFTPNFNKEKPSHNIVGYRRDVLVGLGGLYGATALSNNSPLAIAAPISPPDLITCGPPDLPKDVKATNCCPPLPSSKPIDFEFPTLTTPLRVRPAAHLVNDEYLTKYKEAIKRMKALPPNDPRSFTQQANIHCAYCDGAYHQVNYPDLEIQVHNCWLFFPYHRWYLYFYERILGSLIGDPSFAIQFWNWDNPPGMTIPSIYTQKNSPLYDPLRHVGHQPPTFVDLDYNRKDDDDPDASGNVKDQINSNLSIMYRQVVSNGKLPRLFLGSPYRAGDDSEPGAGSLENVPHGPVHDWTGDKRQSNRENMGIFYSAARDPVFYSHHSNVDRMWSIWKTKVPGGKRRDFTDPDWLESGFLFYDENKNLVRVKVKDSLDTTKLGYVYQDIEIPWLKTKPKPRKSKAKKLALAQHFGIGVAHAAETTPRSVKFPLTLDSKVSTIVKRPKLMRSKEEKEEEEEVLVIDGIEFDRNKAVKFDVFINDEDDKVIGPSNAEFAGSYVSLPHSHVHKNKKIKTCLRLGLTDLLEDLEAENDDSIVVTLVPKYGKGLVTIKGIKIELAAE